MDDHLSDNERLAKWLSGELSIDEKNQLEQADDLNDLKAVIDDIDTWSLPPLNTNSGLSSIKHQANKSDNKTIQFNPLLKVAAVITLLIVSYFSWDWFSSTNNFEIATKTGEQITHTLPDGSTVKLDAASSIIYNKKAWNTERKLTLKGQAFFEVNHGKTFSVLTQKGSVSVLGTSFNIKVTELQMSVRCFEGKVRVASETKQVDLQANEGVQLQDAQLLPFKHTESTPDWINGFSLYTRQSLPIVVEDLNNRFKLSIELPKKYHALEYTGKVPHSDVHKALTSVFAPLEVSYTLQKDGKVDFD